MISIELDSAGRLYVAEKQGRVIVMAPSGGGYTAGTVLADLRNAVDADQESGLLGMALDPNFTTNRYMYLFYTTATDQRLTRITVNSTFTGMTAGSELILISGFPRTVNFHKAGDIHFHPNDSDNIYVAIGDDNDLSGSQDLSRYAGKMLRVSKTNGQGLPTNPYQDGNMNSIRSRIWAIGFRNPFRFAFHPAAPVANAMYVSENGNSTDRISFVRMGSNGSWNSAGDNGGFLNPPDTNHRVMTTDVPSLVGIAIANGGAFADLANPSSPTIYVGNCVTRRVRRWRLTGANFDTLTPIAADNGQPFMSNITPIDIAFAADGSMIISSTQGGEATSNFTLIRVRRTSGTPPIASFTTSPSPARGAPPLLVSFTDTSRDPDGNIASRSWNFGDNTTSTSQNPTHTYSAAGTYTVTLTVTDNTGQTNSAQTTVTAVSGTTLNLSGRIIDGRNTSNTNVLFQTVLRLYRLDGTTPIAFSGGSGPAQNSLTVNLGNINGTINVELTEPGLVISAGETGGLRAAYRAISVPVGSASLSVPLTYYLSGTAIRGRVLDTRGAGAAVDIGVARSAATTRHAIAGGRDYLAGSGYPASGVAHRIVSDSFGYYYIPIRSNQGGANFYFDLVADTGRSTYLPTSFSTNIANNALVTRNITVGLQNGGLSCDDLSAIADTPNVDYATQLQPILTARCTGCHNSSSGSNGGLILDGDSWPNIVGPTSVQVPGKLLIEANQAARSFFFEKINCANPQLGTRMRPTEAMPTSEQALFRSWIAQGAPRQATVVVPPQPPQTPWQSNVHGTSSTLSIDGAGGYHFTPLRNGQITAIGGYFNGTKIVRLFNRTTGAVLAEATVTSANTWAYATIAAVNVVANTNYTVAVYLAGSGGVSRNAVGPFPRTYGDVRIDAGAMGSTSGTGNSAARPTQTSLTNVPGMADVTFVPN